MIRKVIAWGISTNRRTMILSLECGHNRSIGRGIMPDGSRAADKREYNCQDGPCYGK